jgi:hypothetical protein
MQYSLKSDSSAIYKLSVRHSSASGGSNFHIEINGADVTGELSLPTTGGWQNWNTATFENIVVPAGNIRVKYVMNSGSSNLSYFNFTEPKSANKISFQALAAVTSVSGEIYLSLNKEITNEETKLQLGDFELSVDGKPIKLVSISLDSTTSTVLILKHNIEIYSDNVLTLAYNGTSVKSGEQSLLEFSNMVVQNNLTITHLIPGKIQAEDFYINNGLALEECSDIYAGQNTGHTAPGEYLEYKVHVTRAGTYAVNYRVATQYGNAGIIFQVGDGEDFTSTDTFMFTSTGGWQNWETQSSGVHLAEGYYSIRLLIKSGEHNLNWFEFDFITSVNKNSDIPDVRIYPNPANNILNIEGLNSGSKTQSIEIINMQGRLIKKVIVKQGNKTSIGLSEILNGNYLVKLTNARQSIVRKLIIRKN